MVPMQARKASLLFVFCTIALDSIGIGIIIPALPDVVRRFVTGEADVSKIYGYFIAIYALLQFLSSPLLGGLSDRFGRRPVLLVSLLGAAIDYFFMAFAPTLPLLFLGRIVSGITGASYTVASAYIADISDDSNRTKNFGVIGAGFGLGFIIGPAIGGFLASYGSQYPFLAAGAFNLMNFLFGLFVLPESLPPEKRRKIRAAALNPIASLIKVLRMPAIRTLIVVYVLLHLAGQTHPSIWTLYTQHRYGWSTAEVGLSLAAVGLLSAATQAGLAGILVAKLGEARVLVYGALGEAVSFALFGLAYQGWMLYAILLFSCVFWSIQPAIQSLISREVPAHEQGELQGSLMSLASLTGIVNPLIMTWLFAATSDRSSSNYLPGSPYLLSGGLILVGWMLAARWNRNRLGAAQVAAGAPVT